MLASGSESASSVSLDDLRARAKSGDPASATRLAMYYESGVVDTNGVRILDRNHRMAVSLYRSAAMKGNKTAMVNLARLFEHGLGVKRNKKKAVQLLRRAARSGDEVAAFNLGVEYLSVRRHRDAVKWFRKAVELGDETAIVEIARAKIHGLGTRRDVESGVRALASVAMHTGDREAAIEASLMLFRLYIEGWLVPRSTKKAMKWLERASGFGDEEASVILKRKNTDIIAFEKGVYRL